MLIFLFGEDSFQSSQKLKEIKDKFLLKDPAGSGLSIFDFAVSKSETASAISALETKNLLADKRLVVIKNILTAGAPAEAEKLLAFLKSQKGLKDDQDTVAVFWEDGKVKKSVLLCKFLQKNARSQEFEKISGQKLEQWVLRQFREAGHESQISQTALEKLVAYAGEDMRLLSQEVQKLAAYGAGGMITEQAVETLVKANLNSNIFATIDALGANQKKTALDLLHRHLAGGEDPFYLLSMFVYQFRNLIKVADLKNNYGANEYAIAKAGKLHPFVVKKSLAQLRHFSWEQLRQIYQKLAQLDTAVKTGKIEIKLALDKFIVEL